MRREYEIRIKIINDDFTNDLIVALVRQGYSVYLSDNEEICYTAHEEEVTEIKVDMIRRTKED
jgi:hypothetical protein